MAYDRDNYGRGDFRQQYGNNDYHRSSGGRDQQRSYGARSYGGRDDDDRGFIDRAGDEVRSWFGDEEAEQRRERDEREAERQDRYSSRSSSGSRMGGSYYNYGRDPQSQQSQRDSRHDPAYSDWRQRQIDALDRDYDEYRREHQSKFDNEFHGWRTTRQGQRSSLDKVEKHMEVVGNDGEHVGQVDKVRGDRIILTKNDPDAGGHHHSIPCSWIESVDDKIKISKNGDEAKRVWRDEERQSAMFSGQGSDRQDGPHNLNRAFSGTY